MEKRIVVSGGNELRVFSLPQLRLLQRVCLDGAGPLAAGAGMLFCACNPGGEIWRLSPDTLVPQALFSGGPGVCAMALSHDGRRLYALCGEGDSVLMLDAMSGQPMLLARAGLCPQGLSLLGDMLAVAGGEDAAVFLLDADTLCLRARASMPGPVVAAELFPGGVHALCLNETLSSVLVSCPRGSAAVKAQLPGMPGALLASQGRLLAATHGRLFARSEDGRRALCCREAPGRAGRLIIAGERLFLCDAFSEGLFVLGHAGGCWRPVCEHACDVIAI